jgi:hypothetical protein
MLDFWFGLPIAGLFAVLAATYALISIVIHLITFRSPLRAASRSLAGIAPPLFGVVGLLFGLLTGFLAADIGDHKNQAAQAVSAETNALYEVRTLSIASASDMAGIRDALREYVRSELQDEWPRMSDFGRSAKTEAAFSNLLREVADPKIARESGAAIHTALLNAVSQVGRARSQRLAISTDATNTVKWITVLILAMITQVAIGLVHVEKPRAQIAALALFTSALVVALGLMAMQEWPFSGLLQISPAPLRAILDLIPA